MVRAVPALLALGLAGCVTAPKSGGSYTPGASAVPPGSHPGLAGTVAVRSAPPAADTPDPAEVRALEAAVRDLLVTHAPDPLVQSAQGWGKQEPARSGPRNHGHWRRVAVRVPNPQTIGVGITEAAYPEPGTTTFTAMVGADCAIRFEQQVWRHGLRVYSGETRGRCRAAVLLKCEATTRTEPKKGGFLAVPDVVVRVRVTEAHLFYEGLVIDHTAGVGGDAAKSIGETLIDAVKALKPDLERDLLAKANAAIVKAADTKDVRLSLGGLFGR